MIMQLHTKNGKRELKTKHHTKNQFYVFLNFHVMRTLFPRICQEDDKELIFCLSNAKLLALWVIFEHNKKLLFFYLIPHPTT